MSLGGFGTYGGLGEMGVVNVGTPIITTQKPVLEPTLEEHVEDENKAS